MILLIKLYKIQFKENLCVLSINKGDLKISEIENLFENEEFEEVINSCEEIFEDDPQNKQALSYYSSALYFLGRYDDAIQCLSQAIDLYPNSYEFQIYKLSCFIDSGNLNEAYNFFKSSDEKIVRMYNLEYFASKLLEAEDYSKAKDVLDTLNQYQKDNSEVIDGYKIIINNSDLKPEYDEKYYMNWIGTIKEKSSEISCPVCGEEVEVAPVYCSNCDANLLRVSEDLKIESKDLALYNYACVEVLKLKLQLKEKITLDDLKAKLNHLDDDEFSSFIYHLKEIDYIKESEYIELN